MGSQPARMHQVHQLCRVSSRRQDSEEANKPTGQARQLQSTLNRQFHRRRFDADLHRKRCGWYRKLCCLPHPPTTHHERRGSTRLTSDISSRYNHRRSVPISRGSRLWWDGSYRGVLFGRCLCWERVATASQSSSQKNREGGAENARFRRSEFDA